MTDDTRAEMRIGLERSFVRAPAGAGRRSGSRGRRYVTAFANERDENGHRLVTRTGRAERLTITTAAGEIEIEAPRVNDKCIDQAAGGASRPGLEHARAPRGGKSPKVSEVLPLMYLHGLSSGEFAPALEVLAPRR